MDDSWKWEIYEAQKRELQGLAPDEYESAIKNLADELEV